MSLDATVYCDCFEKGRLLSSPPHGVRLQVDEAGYVVPAEELGDLEKQIEFDTWVMKSACAHEDMVLCHRRLGNSSAAAILRQMLATKPETFPIMLSKIVYDGSHAGDMLALEQVCSLLPEIDALRDFRSPEPEWQGVLDQFRTDMSDLAAASLSVKKPVLF